jgi:RNA polymerase sigma-70 factor (ECF subfamily)
MSLETDEEIAKRVQSGDVKSFGVLIERYEEKIARYARKFLLRGEDVKDIVQEVFIKVYVNIQSFDTAQRFSPWIYRIAHNEFINAIKKKERGPLFFFDLDTIFPQPVASDTADSESQKQEIKKILDRCLEKLSPLYREPLVLYYYEDNDYKEIADILHLPIPTVSSRLRRGRAMLRALVEETHGTNI